MELGSDRADKGGHRGAVCTSEAEALKCRKWGRAAERGRGDRAGSLRARVLRVCRCSRCSCGCPRDCRRPAATRPPGACALAAGRGRWPPGGRLAAELRTLRCAGHTARQSVVPARGGADCPAGPCRVAVGRAMLWVSTWGPKGRGSRTGRRGWGATGRTEHVQAAGSGLVGPEPPGRGVRTRGPSRALEHGAA